MAKIFITYRRRDNAYAAELLREKLGRRFGKDNVFMDVEDIPPGSDYDEKIKTALESCDALLVVIGADWLRILKERAEAQTEDLLREEIEKALARGITVIPVLLNDGLMPPPEELPELVKPMARKEFARFRSGKDLTADCKYLLSRLGQLFADQAAAEKLAASKSRQALKPKPKQPPRPPRSAAKKPKILSETDKSAKVLLELEKIFAGFADERFYIGAAIPPDKLRAALDAYAPAVAPEDVILLYDSTVFGGAKNGTLLTYKGVYWSHLWEEPGEYQYWQIHSVDEIPSSIYGSVRVNDKEIRIGMGDFRRTAELMRQFLRRVSARDFYAA